MYIYLNRPPKSNEIHKFEEFGHKVIVKDFHTVRFRTVSFNSERNIFAYQC